MIRITDGVVLYKLNGFASWKYGPDLVKK